jgi:hypothetical protein
VTEPERAQLRILIDQATRERLTPREGCRGCGTEYGNVTLGCQVCYDRARHRRYCRGGQVRSHGVSGYDRGCRCEICSAARARLARGYRLRRKLHGMAA